MFQFPRFPPPHSWSVTCLQVGLPHSDSLGSLVASTSPRHFAAWPRPSSAESAKATTMCSSLTMSVLVFTSVSLCYGARGDTSVSPRSQARPAHFRCQGPTHTPSGGAAGIRTPDLRRAKAALSQLSYGPVLTRPAAELLPPRRIRPVGAPGLEPGTSALSGPRSNHLSYAPDSAGALRSVYASLAHKSPCAEDEAKPDALTISTRCHTWLPRPDAPLPGRS